MNCRDTEMYKEEFKQMFAIFRLITLCLLIVGLFAVPTVPLRSILF